MSFEVSLTGDNRPITVIKVWDRLDYLRREIRIYGNGKVDYREWDRKDTDMTFGWVDLIEPLEDRR